MAVATMVGAVLRVVLLIGGVVVALMLRRRDSRAALLAVLGFGCVLLSSVVSLIEGLVVSRIVRAAPREASAVFLIIGAVITLIELAGFVLIFLGLLRVRPG